MLRSKGRDVSAARVMRRTGRRRPVRVVHLGLGNFFRAHQAWYTAHAPDGWGIAAFTGRHPDQADKLAHQDGLYSLITRGPERDEFEIIDCLSAVHPASDHQAFLDYLRSPDLAVVTLTVTEAAYRLDDPRLTNDLDTLRQDPTAPVKTIPARLVAGLIARQRAGAPRIAIVPCDNLPNNGAVLQNLVGDLIPELPEIPEIPDNTASFVTTMVDRITPRATPDDHAAVLRATGVRDASPVVTEPFSEWILSGEFPAGRPRWEDAGAVFVDDIAPFEQRKLWLLNGGHSLLAYAASIRGHETVADAVADPQCRAWLEQLWDEASRHLADTGIPAYRRALLERFRNPRMRHLLAQIAADGSQKLPVRIVPLIRAERAAGRMPTGAARVIAAWIWHLRGRGAPITDPYAGRFLQAAAAPLDQAVTDTLTALGLDGDPALSETIHRLAVTECT
jgi:fructuronate reductase